MKKSLLVFTLCVISLASYAELKELNNGWRQFVYEGTMDNPLDGRYSVALNDTTKFIMYLDVIPMEDTLCVLTIESRDINGKTKIFYLFDDKATYFFNVFRDSETERFSMIKFEYNEDNEFTTGFNPNGLGQNKLATQIALQLLNGHQLKLVVPSKSAPYQEIKKLTIPSVK